MTQRGDTVVRGERINQNKMRNGHQHQRQLRTADQGRTVCVNMPCPSLSQRHALSVGIASNVIPPERYPKAESVFVMNSYKNLTNGEGRGGGMVPYLE